MAFSFFIQHIFVQDLLCAKEHYIRSKKYSSEKDTEVPSWRFCYIGGKDIGKKGNTSKILIKYGVMR